MHESVAARWKKHGLSCRPQQLRVEECRAGRLDASAYPKAKDACVVRRFAPDEDPVDGRLAHHGSRWYFDYEGGEPLDDEPVFRLGEHRFSVGEYVSVTDEDGRLLTYKVTEVTPA